MHLYTEDGFLKPKRFLFQLFVVYVVALTGSESKPQDVFQSIATGAVQIAAQAGEIASKGGALRDDRGFEVPFAKVHSKSEAGVGDAIVHRNYDDDSSEEDRRRRKRSLDDIYLNLIKTQSSMELQSLLPPLHFHRYKRAACHSMGGGSTGGGGGAGDGDDIDVVERRRKAARKRKAAQQKKARNTKKTTRKSKKKLVSDDEVAQPVRRRKRQTEVDDLNGNMNAVGKDFSQHAQQFAEKVRMAWENLMKNMSQMAEQIKQAFQGGAGDQMGEDI